MAWVLESYRPLCIVAQKVWGGDVHRGLEWRGLGSGLDGHGITDCICQVVRLG